MDTKKLLLLRNFFYKWFIVGFLIFVAGTILYVILKDVTVEMAVKLFRVSRQEYYLSMFYFLSWVKAVLFIFTLSPALALHWLIKAEGL